MATDEPRAELGEFLKARRAELDVERVGIRSQGRRARRVSGLRREEVAQLASISTDYYTRIEQGRMATSAPVLATLADVLELTDDQRGYLFSLAGKQPLRRARAHHQAVQAQLRRVLDDLVTVPAIVMGRRMDVLGWNSLASAMILDFGRLAVSERNYVRVMFTEPTMRGLYDDWEAVARTAVAQLRMEAGRYPDDPRLAALVGTLSLQDRQFAQWWAAREVASLSTGTKVLNHPRVGRLVLEWDTLTATTDPDQQLVVWTAEEGSSTHDALRLLGRELDATT